MAYRIGRRRFDDNRCSCFALAVCRRWEEVAWGPGGGLDIVWGVVPSCAGCAVKAFERYPPHILPEGLRPEDAKLVS